MLINYIKAEIGEALLKNKFGGLRNEITGFFNKNIDHSQRPLYDSVISKIFKE